MRPQHRLALLIVGMYCVLLYFRKFFDSLSMMFLVQGLIVTYGYGGDVRKFEKIILWCPGVRLKSFVLYGVLIFFFLWILFGVPPR